MILLSMSLKSEPLPEYRLKVAFIYNFIAYTEWPDELDLYVKLCLLGDQPFGEEIDSLEGRRVNQYYITVLNKKHSESLQACDALYIADNVIYNLQEILEKIGSKPVLTIADSKHAIENGIMLNMIVAQGKIKFEANYKSARSVGFRLNSKLLRLATRVYQ